MSDHFLLTIETKFSRPRPPRKVIRCRNVKAIDRSQFRADLFSSALVTDDFSSVDDLVDSYNILLSGLLDRHAPEKEKRVPDRPMSPWFNEDVIQAKQTRRRAERKMRKTGLTVHREIYTKARNHVTQTIKKAKVAHFKCQLSDASSD